MDDRSSTEGQMPEKNPAAVALGRLGGKRAVRLALRS